MKLTAESRQTKICVHVSCKIGLKQNVSLPFISNFALECAIRRVLAGQGGLKLIGTYQLVGYNDDLNVLGAGTCTIKENREASVFVSNEFVLKLNYKKTKYMVMSRDQHAVKKITYIYIYMGNKSFERVEHFKYSGTSRTNQNSFHEEIKCRLQSGNACYYSVQNLLSSSLPSKNIKVKIYRTILLSFVSYGCESWLPKVIEEHKLRVFRNRVIRKIFGPTMDMVMGEWER
jgi:hypothetical protein